jgi:hypothetical protein
MNNIDSYLDAGNIKFRSNFRDSMYHVLREKDKTKLIGEDEDEDGLLSNITNLFCNAFAIGYHFNKAVDIAPNSTNHVNLVSIDRDIKELMVHLILKRHPDMTDPKELWKEVNRYSEYGIQVLFNSWNEKNRILDLSDIMERTDL